MHMATSMAERRSELLGKTIRSPVRSASPKANRRRVPCDYCPGSMITHMGGGVVGVGMGPVIHEASARFVLSISHSRDNDGERMLLGVSETGASARAVGYCPYWGRMQLTHDVFHQGDVFGDRLPVLRDGRAKSATVEVIVEDGAVSFSVNGMAQVDAGIRLAGAFRPFVQLANAKDAIVLAARRDVGLAAGPPRWALCSDCMEVSGDRVLVAVPETAPRGALTPDPVPGLHPASASAPRWEKKSSCLEISGDGTVVTHDGKRAAVAFGAPVTQGVHTWTFTIAAAKGDNGFGMVLGVADADAPFNDKRGGSGWGFSPYWGKLQATDDVYCEGEQCKTLMAGTLRGRATGATVEVTVDMGSRSLTSESRGVEHIPHIPHIIKLSHAHRTHIARTSHAHRMHNACAHRMHSTNV